MNPLNYINKWFQAEFWNPNPRMAALKSGDRYTLTFEVDKETFDLFCDVGGQNRHGMILEVVAKVTQSPAPVGVCDDNGEVQEQAPSNGADTPQRQTGVTAKGSSRKPRDGQISKPEAQKGGQLARLAGMWTLDSRFQRWVHRQIHGEDGFETKEACDRFIKEVCGIESKRELDNFMDKATLFHEIVRRPFSLFVQEARHYEEKTLP